MATHSSILAWRIPGTESLVGCRLWGRTESDTTEATQQQQQQQQPSYRPDGRRVGRGSEFNTCCLSWERVSCCLQAEGRVCFSMHPSSIFVSHRVSSASLLYSGAPSLLFSLGSSCLFIVFWRKMSTETFQFSILLSLLESFSPVIQHMICLVNSLCTFGKNKYLQLLDLVFCKCQLGNVCIFYFLTDFC